MNEKAKKVKPTRQQLADRLKEVEAQLAHVYGVANAEIDRCGTNRLMGSGVLVEMKFIGGKRAVIPFVIKDGLSDATIAAIKADLMRSYELATIVKPTAKRGLD